MPRAPDLLAHLTDAQREAVTHVEGPLLILAGPGSGKTRVVTHRIANLLKEGIPADEILALTFTNKAADEMRLRVQQLAPDRPVWLGTFHRFCAMLLRRYATYVGLEQNYSIFDTDDSLAELKLALAELPHDLTHVTPERIARSISAAKNKFLTPETYQPEPGNPAGAIVAAAFPLYQKRLLASNAVDFDDLLVHVARLLKDNPELRRTLDARYRFILVDEYQDTNLVQYAIVRGLSQDHPNLAVTGDPDQSIYGWRGANLRNILEFEHDYPEVKVVRLEQNYRSTKSILRVADALITHNVRRKHKDLFTDNAEGEPVRLIEYLTHHDEARDVAEQIRHAVHEGDCRPRDVAILYRVNSLSRSLEHMLREHGLPYQIVKGLEFYQRKEIKDVVAYLCLMNNPRNDVAFLRVVNVPQRKIGKSTIARLLDHARDQNLSLLGAAREAALVPGLAQRSAVAVAKFVALIDKLGEFAGLPVEEVLGHVLTHTGYEDMLKASDDPDDDDRLANVFELVTAAREFDAQHPTDGGLEEFLQQAVLVNDQDGWETETDKVTLMTLHAAKGLEFPRVFVVGLEEGLLPHERSRESRDQLEEERRLLFVGITRAKSHLQLSYAGTRAHAGGNRPAVPSSFLLELPRDEMTVFQPRSYARRDPECQLADHDDADLEFPPRDVSPPREPADSIVSPSAAEPTAPPPPRAPANTAGFKLRTAATMLPGGSTAASFSPDAFSHGMLVEHPQHGLGKIVALSGEGISRRATVKFFTVAEEVKFVLSYSPLRPANGK